MGEEIEERNPPDSTLRYIVKLPERFALHEKLRVWRSDLVPPEVMPTYDSRVIQKVKLIVDSSSSLSRNRILTFSTTV